MVLLPADLSHVQADGEDAEARQDLAPFPGEVMDVKRGPVPSFHWVRELVGWALLFIPSMDLLLGVHAAGG